MKLINRSRYVEALVERQWNGRIKIVTGIRRCGKSTILFELFRNRLLEDGVKQEEIISIALDDYKFEKLRNPGILSDYIRDKTSDSKKNYYVLIDEIQYAISLEELRNKDEPVKLYSVLNGFLHQKNIDVYVTGSNSKLLSSDVSTEFRGRGDVVHIFPLSFKEFVQAKLIGKRDAYDEYVMYGGMPYLLHLDKDEDKYDYLSLLFEEIYFKDIEERYRIQLPGVLRSMTDSICSSVGSMTNASKISRTIKSKRNLEVDSETVSTYLRYLCESFLFSEAKRYDVKGKRYYEYPAKYYCTDVGLRNIRLGLRQMEESHIMENCIYNELKVRGYLVDIGVVQVREKTEEGQIRQKNCEIDFIARKGNKVYYIQSALNMDNLEKEKTELRPFLTVNDSFRKIVVSKSTGKSWIDENGILRIGTIDFLYDENSLDR